MYGRRKTFKKTKEEYLTTKCESGKKNKEKEWRRLEKKLIGWTFYGVAVSIFASTFIVLYFIGIKAIHGSIDISLLSTVVLWIVLLVGGSFFLKESRKAFRDDKEEAKKEQ